LRRRCSASSPVCARVSRVRNNASHSVKCSARASAAPAPRPGCSRVPAVRARCSGTTSKVCGQRWQRALCVLDQQRGQHASRSEIASELETGFEQIQWVTVPQRHPRRGEWRFSPQTLAAQRRGYGSGRAQRAQHAALRGRSSAQAVHRSRPSTPAAPHSKQCGGSNTRPNRETMPSTVLRQSKLTASRGVPRLRATLSQHHPPPTSPLKGEAKR
jgi:hypothetical protein